MARSVGVWGVAAALLVAQAGAAAAAPYLFDVLKRPAYRAAWGRLLASEPDLPPWLRAYARTYDGPATPGGTAVVAGSPRELFHVCEAHNCAGSQFEVMFGPGGAGPARGLLKVEGEPARFLGGPSPAERRALAGASD